MLKEIHEQPRVVQETFSARVDFERGRDRARGAAGSRPSASPASSGCTSSPAAPRGTPRWSASSSSRSWPGCRSRSTTAPSIRYRDPILDDKVLAVGVSQSGETADTLVGDARRPRSAARCSPASATCRGARRRGSARATLFTHAGPEIGVASTKAFTTQLVAFYLLALYLRQCRGEADRPRAAQVALARAAGDPGRARPGARHRGDGAALVPRRRLPLPGARHQLPDRARRSPEAQGDLLHPRRGLPRGRDEARADRADRRGPAGGRRGDRRPRLREDARATCRR